jgi:chromosome segregation ATPase
MLKINLLGVGLVASVMFCANVEAKLYKWVDDNGTTHYGETIPPEYANKDTTQLDDKGFVEKHVEKLTPEERQAKAKDNAKKNAEQQAAVESQRKDDALLSTFSNEKEIDLARDRSVQQVEARVDSYKTLLKSAQETLAGHHKELDNFNSQNKKIPVSLTEDIAESEAKVAKLQKDLDQSEKELANIKARFESEKLRYRELKNGTANAPVKK